MRVPDDEEDVVRRRRSALDFVAMIADGGLYCRESWFITGLHSDPLCSCGLSRRITSHVSPSTSMGDPLSPAAAAAARAQLLNMLQARLSLGGSLKFTQETAGNSPQRHTIAAQETAGPTSPLRVTATARRRMAVFSETTEHLASRLWHSALDAVRKPEAKSPQQASELLGMLQVHPIFCDLESSLLLRMVSALRSELVAGGDVVIRQGDLGDAFYLVAPRSSAARGTRVPSTGGPWGSSHTRCCTAARPLRRVTSGPSSERSRRAGTPWHQR